MGNLVKHILLAAFVAWSALLVVSLIFSEDRYSTTRRTLDAERAAMSRLHVENMLLIRELAARCGDTHGD